MGKVLNLEPGKCIVASILPQDRRLRLSSMPISYYMNR